MGCYEEGKWCPGAESNHRHCDFQSHALPTELPGRRGPPKGRAKQSARFIEAGFRPVQTSRWAVGKRSKPAYDFDRNPSPGRTLCIRPLPKGEVKGSLPPPLPRTSAVLPVARLLARVSLPVGVVLGFHRRNRVVAGQPAIEVDILAAPGTERPKACRRGLAANGAGSGRLRWFRHSDQITQGRRP